MGLWAAIVVFAVAAAVILVVGTRLTRLADELADTTGLGEAFTGAVFLGAVTSLPGLTASVVAAADGRAEMALSNAIGGIAAQTAFLAIADLCYRKANLEHAAASVANMVQAALLGVLLTLMLVAMAAPAVSVVGVHPVSLLVVVVYIAGLKMVRTASESPMWQARRTRSTREDVPDEGLDASQNGARWLWFAGLAVVVVGAGYAVTRSAAVFEDELWWVSGSVAGAVFTAVSTSLPELVTSIAAVRRGALTLAVGGIVGGNCFDTLFAAVADGVYRGGSLYHSGAGVAGAGPAGAGGGSREMVLLSVSVLMTLVLLLGLLRRQEQGPAGIGFESVLVLVMYAGMLGLVAWM